MKEAYRSPARVTARQRRNRIILNRISTLTGLAVTCGIAFTMASKTAINVYAADKSMNLEAGTSSIENNSGLSTEETAMTLIDADSIPMIVIPMTKEAVNEAINESLDNGLFTAWYTSEIASTEDSQQVDASSEPAIDEESLSDKLAKAESNSEYAWIFLTSPAEIGGAALTKAGAAAVIGCMQAESGVNPEALNSSDGGYGLLQWTDTTSCFRKTNLYDWCNNNGFNPDTMLGQLSFAAHELRTVYSQDNGYIYPVYETLQSSGDISNCLKNFFSHAEAGTNVQISKYNWYGGHSTTLSMYTDRLNYSWSVYYSYMDNEY